jgi:hypothetical protein
MRGWALRLFGYAVVLNFLLFCAISIEFGDALQGKVVNGQYYLGNHGIYTGVSHTIFIYSACHAYSALGGIVALIGIAWKSRKIQTETPPRNDPNIKGTNRP